MKKFSESEYFLIKIFRKVPFAWIAFIIIIFYMSIYIVAKNILAIEHPSSIEILRFYLGNSLFSIFAIWLSVKVYEQSVITIDEWINKNDILGNKDDIINNRTYAFETLFSTSIDVFCIVYFILTDIRYADTDYLYSNA